MYKKIMFSILFILLALGLAGEKALGLDLAAYWDGNYGTAWAGGGEATRDALEAAGYQILDAEQLKTWMDAHIPNGRGSVVVFCRDAAPDTVVETMSDTCTLRRYLDAGGKIVWQADIPFYYMTTAGGANTTWGDAGAPAILGFNTSGVARDVGGSTITPEGIEWGITESWGSQRAANPDLVDIVLATDNNGNACAWVKFYVPGDTGGGFVRIRDTGGQANVEDIMRVAEYGLGRNPYARAPEPADGDMISQTWASMTWIAGDFAVSHDVYMGDNFDDVNNAAPDSELFRGNQPLGTEFYIAGFAPGAYPEGLVPGTTYYWRIDEVNDANTASPWKGPVWSFWVQPEKAYAPDPGDNAAFIDSEGTTLSWSAGFGAKLHIVYFGDDYDTVANATDGTLQGVTNYNPGPLEIEKTYYWRIDQFVDAVTTHKGDVWSFKTAKEGGGIRGDYYNGMNFETFVVTRTDPEIDFDWGDPGGPDPGVGDDQFSCRWTGEVEAAYTETYTFYTRTDDGGRLWVNGQQLVDAWIDQGPTEYSGEIDLVAGNSYSIVMEHYENGGGAVAELRWSSPSTPKEIIPQAALAPPVKASSPNPYNGATGTKMTPILTWGAGDHAVSHEVYFGTDADAVANADKSSPEYKGAKTLGDESYDPGKLEWFTQYFWRIDEVNDLNPDSPWIGNLWTFTTGDFIVVDDFEDYDVDKPIWEYWFDGLGFGTPGTPGYNPGNGTGSAVGDDTSPSYMEESIVHSGRKSLPYSYDNNKQGFANYSEAELTLDAPRDWTEEGVAELSLWFRGYPASTGSFVEAPVGTYTMTGSGADIWTVNGVEADEFHFAYKMLTGAGSIVARVDSIQNTNDWAKAGVMIRETLDPDSAHAYMIVTPTQGVSFQRRPGTAATSTSDNSVTGGSETAPYWVKIERGISGNFTASSSTNGSTWTPLGTPQNIQMGTNVYIGLAVTSHDTALTCQAVFSNVTTVGSVTGQWTNQDIGILSNDTEPLYVAVSNATGSPAIVVNDDPDAATIDTWTEWVIPLSAFSDQGIVSPD
ncbi:MAG: PA14 domain-containing protein [Planctomycetota bacterium]|jgi:hypothetical protein